MTTYAANPICKCGVFEYAHTKGYGCGKFRRAGLVARWFLDHSPRDHFAGMVWLRVPEKVRWALASRFHERHPNLCWCEMADAALLLGADDYRKPNGCGCHVPLLTDARPIQSGTCYCDPSESTS
jgi:hypothetical protein